MKQFEKRFPRPHEHPVMMSDATSTIWLSQQQGWKEALEWALTHKTKLLTEAAYGYQIDAIKADIIEAELEDNNG